MAYPFPRSPSADGGRRAAVAAVPHTQPAYYHGPYVPYLVQPPPPPPPTHHGSHQLPPPPPPPLPDAVQRKPASCGKSAASDADSIELNEGLIALFASMETRRAGKLSKHQQQQQQQQQRRGGASAVRKAAGEVVLPAQEEAASRAAQEERQHARQRQEQLYGARAAEVRALEATLNRGFDRAVRVHRPPLWPSVPLSSATQRVVPVRVV